MAQETPVRIPEREPIMTFDDFLRLALPFLLGFVATMFIADVLRALGIPLQ